MRTLVGRVCTEVHTNGWSDPLRGESRPLSGFRSRPALVLLGDPGAGKTTEFKQERRALGESAEYIPARDFIALDIDSHPEWREKTLFIDGLDEVRAGVKDSRVPLDIIRRRLDRLRPRGFRISCREADWLGGNDREKLALVAPADGGVTVVHLEPLDEMSVKEILGSVLSGDVDQFLEESRHRGIWPLLKNPLTLQLVVDSTRNGEGWPRSRRETFAMACRGLATEQNPEHKIAAPVPPIGVRKATGYLCALALLADIEGYSLLGEDSPSFIDLDQVSEGTEIAIERLKGALATKLFSAEGEGLFRPVHRQVAEFLGGRYLAELVEEGLPAQRVTSLMTSPGDGRVVTPLRGLSAWLATHSPEARTLLIDADPVGVGLYGDIRGMTKTDKTHLLRSLAALAAKEPLSGPSPADTRTAPGKYRAWTFRSLVFRDMIPVIDDLLNIQRPGAPDDRVIEFLAGILEHADRDLESLTTLAPSLCAIVQNRDRSPWVRRDALDAYLNIAPATEMRTQRLIGLLEETQATTLADPTDEIRGTLLRFLYPDKVSPNRVWKFAASRNRKNLVGRFWIFWNRTLFEKSSGPQLGELLDALCEDTTDIVQSLEESRLEDLPPRLLARALDSIADDLDTDRLYNWLAATNHARIRNESGRRQGVDDIRAWLEARPHIQKEIILKRLEPGSPDKHLAVHSISLGTFLYRSRPPAELGRWFLDQAIDLAGTRPALARKLLRNAYRALGDPRISEGLTLDLMQERLRGHAWLAQELDELHRQRQSLLSSSPEKDWQQQIDQRRERQRAKRKREREEWADLLRSQEAELRNNTFSPANLHTLALAYFGEFPDNERGTPYERVREFIGGDPQLADAVMVALRGALWRDDLPGVDETISLHSQKRLPFLAYAVQASMHLLAAGPEPAFALESARKEQALTLYYCFPLGREETRECRDMWFRQDPDLVLDTLHRCAVAALRNGEEHLPAGEALDRFSGYDSLANEARLKLIDAFPARIPRKQIRQFDRLVGKALRHSDGAELLAMAKKRLALKSLNVDQRIRWITVVDMLSTEPDGQQLKDYVVAGDERRVRHLAEFLNNSLEQTGRHPKISGYWNAELLANLVRILGSSYRPRVPEGLVTLEIAMSEFISAMIRHLSSMEDAKTRRELSDLVEDPQLARWRNQLLWAQETQRAVYRDASFSHPGVEEVQRTLGNREPANPADLAALLCDHFGTISEHIRGDSANLWRQFWNEDSHGRPTEGKPEDSCRDVLLEALRQRLPSRIDVAPEGRYAGGKRSDIRATFNGFNVPVEIKKNSHRQLWSALRNQLINRYTTDPSTSGCGIFLVLWFGADRTTPPPSGQRPTTPQELRRRLESQLEPDETRKISVIAIDVTKPGDISP